MAGPAAENVMRLLPEAEPPTGVALARYFEACGAACLEHLGRRPLTLVRQVDGVCFFHKGPLPPVPAAVHQLVMRKSDGSEGVRLWVDSLDGLLGLVEIGAVELHPWGATVDDIEHPDRLIFDLDPDQGVSWAAVANAAVALRDELGGRGLDCWPKTTGGRGLHLIVPVGRNMGWEEARALVRSVAEEFAVRDPERFTTKPGAKARSGGKIFIDWLRNGRGASAIGAMSPRARAGGLVSTPVSWSELEAGVDAADFTLREVAGRFAGPVASAA
jgi:bifunctional non-homologous end joining protein LigD